MTPAVSDWVEHSCLKCVCLLDAGKVRFVHFVHFPTVVSLPLSFRAAQTAKNLTNVRLPVTFSEVLAFARDDGSKAIRFLAVSATSRESDSHLFTPSPHLPLLFAGPTAYHCSRHVAPVAGLGVARKNIENDQRTCLERTDAAFMRLARLIATGHHCVRRHTAGVQNCAVYFRAQNLR